MILSWKLCNVQDQDLSRTQCAATRVSQMDCMVGYFKPLWGMDPIARKSKSSRYWMEVCLSENLHQPVSTKKKRGICKFHSWVILIYTYHCVKWFKINIQITQKKKQLEPFLTSSFKKESILPSLVAFCQLAKVWLSLVIAGKKGGLWSILQRCTLISITFLYCMSLIAC